MIANCLHRSLESHNRTGRQKQQSATASPSQPQEAESLVLNVAGKLLMFPRDRSKPVDTNERPVRESENVISDFLRAGGVRTDRTQICVAIVKQTCTEVYAVTTKHLLMCLQLPFLPPVMVASNVENVWSATHPNSSKPHLSEALWLSCGASGMKVSQASCAEVESRQRLSFDHWDCGVLGQKTNRPSIFSIHDGQRNLSKASKFLALVHLDTLCPHFSIAFSFNRFGYRCT